MRGYFPLISHLSFHPGTIHYVYIRYKDYYFWLNLRGGEFLWEEITWKEFKLSGIIWREKKGSTISHASLVTLL